MRFNLHEMEPHIRHIVVVGNAELSVGNHIYIDPHDNALVCIEAGGWLTEKEWKHKRFKKVKVEIDVNFYGLKKETR